MYNNGYSVNEIMAHCNVKSKSTVYQILGKYNVALSRKTWPRTWKSEIGSQGNRCHISDGFACQFKYI